MPQPHHRVVAPATRGGGAAGTGRHRHRPPACSGGAGGSASGGGHAMAARGVCHAAAPLLRVAAGAATHGLAARARSPQPRRAPCPGVVEAGHGTRPGAEACAWPASHACARGGGVLRPWAQATSLACPGPRPLACGWAATPGAGSRRAARPGQAHRPGLPATGLRPVAGRPCLVAGSRRLPGLPPTGAGRPARTAG